MSNLKPCPFCGGKATLLRMNDREWYCNRDIAAGCPECGFHLPFQRGETWEPGKGTFSLEPTCTDEAVAAWNRREVPQ